MATQAGNFGDVDGGLKVTVHPCDVGGEVVVALAGEIDIATAPQIGPVVGRLLERGHNVIDIDLDAVTFLDGSAIAALIAASHEVAAAGGCLRITEHALCRRLLGITGETERLTIR